MKRLMMVAICTTMVFKTMCVVAQTTDKNFKFIDPANMDMSVKPGDNFFLYANGTWLKNNPVPASKTRWGSFDALRQTSLDRLKLLNEDAAKNASKDSLNQRVG